ncbi:MAG: methyltransferase domain-containing protein [Rhodobacteraceae bacterium]|nr:methyltransferase domain-containing protein [Alphaproteobacteria bacterium]NNF71640.1 methyltransferase domain-containing protein [Paracoccaceae bacterium]NNK67736.1 methyltransferase domain-containing protein [Paracoccaceae bacterium]
MAETTPEGLWAPRSVDDTLKVYADWADRYEDDVREMGYVTPARIAMALRQSGANTAKPVLDFGCGTGLSGLALKAVGFAAVDGTDVSPEMLARAEEKGVYQHLWLSTPGDMGHVKSGTYSIITATGVISLGAAPPETLDMLLGVLAPGGLLALSYNDATLEDAAYTGRLAGILAAGGTELLFEEHGAHLTSKGMNATVYILQKT